jgi:hypothetical protein
VDKRITRQLFGALRPSTRSPPSPWRSRPPRSPPKAPATVKLRATATDSDGTIVKVDFFEACIKIGETTTAPYEKTVSG